MDFPHSASVEAAVIVSVKEASGFKSERLVGGVWWHVMYSRNCSVPEFAKYPKYAKKKKKPLCFMANIMSK